MKRRLTLIFGVLLAIMILFQGTPVTAHSPNSMDLSYDFTSQVLTIEVSHSVSDVNTHYIYQVVVEKNSVEVLTRDYTTQNSTSGMSATYTIAADHGDVLSVTAKCIQSGQLTRQITVVDPENTSPTNGGGDWMNMTVLISVAIVVIGVLAMIFAFLKRR
ncbi:MAG: hypothetical protein PVJ05_09160 [Candidatus Thorarchaeota archaeon]